MPIEDLLALPRAAARAPAEDLEEVGLDPDRRPIASVRRPVGRFSNARTKQNVQRWTQPMYGLSDHLNRMLRRASARSDKARRDTRRMPHYRTCVRYRPTMYRPAAEGIAG